MTTLATFRSRVASIIGLDNSTAGDQTFMDAVINEGYVQLLRETRGKVRSATFTPGANADVTMDTSVLFIVEAYLNDMRMTKIALEDLLQMRRGYANVSVTGWNSYYAFSAQDLMSFWPTPAATDTVTVYYVPRPTAMSVSSDQPSDVPAEWQHLIEFYALWRTADLDDDSTSQQGERYRAYYTQGVREMRRDLAFHGRHKLNRSVIPGQTGARFWPRARDIDYGY